MKAKHIVFGLLICPPFWMLAAWLVSLVNLWKGGL